MISLSRLVSDTSDLAYLRRLTVSVACWGAVMLLEASVVLLNDASKGIILPVTHYLAWATFNVYLLALLTPAIYGLGRRHPIITGSKWAQHLVPHAAACLAWLSSQAVGRGIAGWIYTRHHELPADALVMATEWIGRYSLLAFIAYWLIVFIAAMAYLRDEMRQREVREAQLETRLASAELEKLRIQIQPHFLFNTLQAAITLVQEDPTAAEDVLLRLSGLLRISLDQMDANDIPLSRELEFLDLYIGIQRRRFGERLGFEIQADHAILAMRLPPLILQPLVENAIRHGIGKHKGNDQIGIFASEHDGGLQVEIWNTNSVVDDVTERLFQRGVGLRNTKARLECIYGPAASLLFRPLARGGAVAVIFVPACLTPNPEQHSTAGAAV